MDTTDSLAPERRQNLGDREQCVSLLLGAGMVGVGLLRGAPAAAGWLVAGAYLVYRGVSGHCPLLAMTGLRKSADHRPDLERKFGGEERDMVEEASWESFPASDPPPW